MTDDWDERRAFGGGRDFRWQGTADDSASRTVVACVAAVENCDPIELPPLFDAVDPEAIDALFSANGTRGADRVSFRYCGYEIDLRPSVVRVRETE